MYDNNEEYCKQRFFNEFNPISKLKPYKNKEIKNKIQPETPMLYLFSSAALLPYVIVLCNSDFTTPTVPDMVPSPTDPLLGVCVTEY